MDTFLAALFSGTSRGAVYALVALGLVIVWRGAGILNYAQMGQPMEILIGWHSLLQF